MILQLFPVILQLLIDFPTALEVRDGVHFRDGTLGVL